MEKYVVYKYYKSKSCGCSDIVCKFGKKIKVNKKFEKKKWLFNFACGGKYDICYVEDQNGEVIHYSFVVPYCKKFSFMQKNDVQIGPCWTRADHRGKGIYPKVIEHIVAKVLEEDPDAELYMLIMESNAPSTKGISKTGFVSVGECEKTRLLKHYNKVEWYK